MAEAKEKAVKVPAMEGKAKEEEHLQVDLDALARVGHEMEQQPRGYFTVNEVAKALGLPANSGWYIVRALVLLNRDKFEEVGMGRWRVLNGTPPA